MATKDQFTVEVEVNAKQAIAELERLKTSTEGVADAAEKQMKPGMAAAAKSVAQTSEAAKAQAEQLNKNLAAAASLGSAFATLSGQLGPVGAALGASASAAGALYAAMGPMGAAIGAVTGAIPGLIQLVKELSTESKTSAQRLEELRDRIRDTASAYLDAADGAREWRSALAGLLPLEEQQARLMAAREEQIRIRNAITRIEREAQRTSFITGDAGARIAETAIADLRRQLQVVNREAEGLAQGAALALERAAEAERKARAEGEAGDAAKARREGRAAERDRTDELEKAKNEAIRLAQMEADLAQRLVDKEWERLDALKRIAEEEMRAMEAAQASLDLKTKQQQDAREQAELADAEAQKRAKSAKDAAEVERERNETEQQRIKITTRAQAGMEGVLEIAMRTAAVQRESNASVGKAFATAVDEWLKGFALQEAYKGIAATAEAIGSAITNPANAGAKFAEAGIHFALAAAAGGASAAIPNAGGGGGGGGGRGGRPEPVGGGSSSGGGGTIVVNFNAPVSDAEIGRQQERASRAARRRFGS